jgi:hypothetical protein
VKEKIHQREREREKFLRGGKKEEKTSDDDESAPRGLKKKRYTVLSQRPTTATLLKTHALAHKKTENSNDGGGCGAHWRRYFRERRLAFVVVVVGRGDDAKFEKSFE